MQKMKTVFIVFYSTDNWSESVDAVFETEQLAEEYISKQKYPRRHSIREFMVHTNE